MVRRMGTAPNFGQVRAFDVKAQQARFTLDAQGSLNGGFEGLWSV